MADSDQWKLLVNESKNFCVSSGDPVEDLASVAETNSRVLEEKSTFGSVL